MFIFPQNYNFQNKFLGFIDYTTIIFDLIWCFSIFNLINLIFHNLNIKIFLFIFFCLPILLLSFFGFRQESILHIFLYILKFILSEKIIFYRKY